MCFMLFYVYKVEGGNFEKCWLRFLQGINPLRLWPARIQDKIPNEPEKSESGHCHTAKMPWMQEVLEEQWWTEKRQEERQDVLKPGCNSQMPGTGEVYQKERSLPSGPKLHHPLQVLMLTNVCLCLFAGVQHRLSKEHLLTSVTWIAMPSPSIVNTEPATRRPRIRSPSN